MTPIPTPTRPTRRTLALLRTAWTALAAFAAARPAGDLLADLVAGIHRRNTRGHAARDAGLTTVEVAIITAVLLGLATALVVAITVVVNRNVGKIK